MLGVVKARIRPVEGQKLIMFAGFDHTAVFQHDDLIRMANRGQPVGDNERRPARHQSFQRRQQQGLRFRIQRRGRFVENQDRRILQQCARNRDSLALSAGQCRAPFTQHSVVAIR